jgi:predicted nucleic acid-binding protein
VAAPLTCDTSVVVAGLSGWHAHHEVARARLAAVDWLPAHVLAEAVSVLSRLPQGLAVPLHDAVGMIRRIADGRVRQLRGDRYLLMLGAVASAGLGGGSVYDALIGATAREHDATLATLDRKAQRAYAAVGAAYELLA